MSKDKTPRNNKGQRHGYWEKYDGNDKWYKRIYYNSKRVGYEEIYFFNNKLGTKTYYL
jgi:hypothetical protein